MEHFSSLAGYPRRSRRRYPVASGGPEQSGRSPRLEPTSLGYDASWPRTAARPKHLMDLAIELQKIYDSEINLETGWFWDGGIEVRLGDKMRGYLAEESLTSTAEIIPWLQEAIAHSFPHPSTHCRLTRRFVNGRSQAQRARVARGALRGLCRLALWGTVRGGGMPMKTALFRLPVSVLSGWTSVRRGFRGPRMGSRTWRLPHPKR